MSARLDARAAALRAVNTLCLSCWPRVHAHASKILCALLWACGDCSRRALARDSPDSSGQFFVTVSAPADETIRAHALRLGALILLLAGDSARLTLNKICAAVGALRPAGSTMEALAEKALKKGGAAEGDGRPGASVVGVSDDAAATAVPAS